MQKPELKRINLFMEKDIVDVIDAYAAMCQRSRTFVIHELLRPSMPSLRTLLEVSEELNMMTDAVRLNTLTKLINAEEKLVNAARNMPDQLKGITK